MQIMTQNLPCINAQPIKTYILFVLFLIFLQLVMQISDRVTIAYAPS